MGFDLVSNNKSISPGYYYNLEDMKKVAFGCYHPALKEHLLAYKARKISLQRYTTSVKRFSKETWIWL